MRPAAALRDMRVALTLPLALGISPPALAYTMFDSKLFLCTVVSVSAAADKSGSLPKVGDKKLLGASPGAIQRLIRLHPDGAGFQSHCEVFGPLMTCQSYRPELKDVLDYETGRLIEAREDGQYIESQCVPYTIEDSR
jgi:hypothetical protein